MPGSRNRRSSLLVRFWGVRGSYPAPGKATARIGGNSSCVEVVAGNEVLAFDAGTGIIGLGKRLVAEGSKKLVHIFLSHLHHDHIEGLRYFDPIYRSDWQCRIYGPRTGRPSLEKTLSRTMDARLFPVSLDELDARLSIINLARRQTVELGSDSKVRVVAHHSNAHPKVGVTMYRIEAFGRRIVYATDVEGPKGGFDDVASFATGADLLIHDAQYTDHEYFGAGRNKAGWGHSTVRMATEVAIKAGVKKLVLYHHDPSHDDKQVIELERLAKSLFRPTISAREGLEISV